MPIMLWNPFSISYLVELILVSIIAGHFLTRIIAGVQTLENRQVNWGLFVTFGALSTSILLQFAKATLHPNYYTFALAWISPAGILALCGYIHFAYCFPANLKHKFLEKSLVRIFHILVLGYEIYIGYWRHSLLLEGIVEYRPSWMDLFYIVGFAWVLLTFFRQMVQAIATDQKLGWFLSIVMASKGLLMFWKPLHHSATVARAFLWVSMLPLVLVFVIYLKSQGYVSVQFEELSSVTLFLSLIFGFANVYLNYAPDRSSYRIKLIGVSLTTLLAIISGISWIISPIYIDQYKYDNVATKHSNIRFEPTSNGGYTSQFAAYKFDTELGERIALPTDAIELPFTFTFFEKNYDQFYVRSDGLVGFDFAPTHADLYHRFGPQPALYPLFVGLSVYPDIQTNEIPKNAKRGFYVKSQPNQMVLTWNQLIATIPPYDEYSFQVILQPNGTIEYSYENLPETIVSDIFTSYSSPLMIGITPGSINGNVQRVKFIKNSPILGATNTGLMEDYKYNFQLFLDKLYAPIAYFIMATSLFIILAFPIFFRVNLDRPLARLLGGVEGFRSGEMSTAVPVAFPDEIGFLTQSFNEMAFAQQELVNTLEEKVEIRTAEAIGLAAKNARLEERSHLSRELHDTVAQTLFSATLIADALPGLWQEENKPAKQALDEIRDLNSSALSEMRLMLFALRPAEFLEYPLGNFLEKIAKNFEKKTPIKVSIQIESDAILPEKVQFTFYRIAQECFNNIEKHANASQVELIFDAVPTQAMLTISDNGQGFHLNDVPSGHLGLKIMRERIEIIGGVFEIETNPKAGTSISIIWFKNDSD